MNAPSVRAPILAFAVSDGASDGTLSGAWARSLVEAYVSVGHPRWPGGKLKNALQGDEVLFELLEEDPAPQAPEKRGFIVLASEQVGTPSTRSGTGNGSPAARKGWFHRLFAREERSSQSSMIPVYHASAAESAIPMIVLAAEQARRAAKPKELVPTKPRRIPFLESAAATFSKEKATYQERKAKEGTLAWYEESGLDQGAFATLLGVTVVNDPEDCRYVAYAVGDSCIAHVREDTLLRQFPLSRSSDFSTTTPLLKSEGDTPDNLRRKVKLLCERLQPGDRVYLMTDAVAAWFAGQLERERKPWKTIDASWTEGEASLERMIGTLRREGALKDDDVAILRIECED